MQASSSQPHRRTSPWRAVDIRVASPPDGPCVGLVSDEPISRRLIAFGTGPRFSTFYFIFCYTAYKSYQRSEHSSLPAAVSFPVLVSVLVRPPALVPPRIPQSQP